MRTTSLLTAGALALGLAVVTCGPALAATSDAKMLINERYNRCLDAANDGGDDLRRPAILWDCHGGDNQTWTFYGDGTISPTKHQDMCLDVPGESGGADGTQLIMWPCHGGANQRWHRLTDGTIESEAHPGKCLDASADMGGANGSAIVLWECHARGNQRWVEVDADR